MDARKIWLAVSVGLLVAGILGLPMSKAANGEKTVYIAEIDDETIDSGTAHYIGNAVTRAEKDDAPLVIKMDTPGGLLQPTKKIVDRVLNSETGVVCWTTPRGAYAYSAGTYILLSSDVAAMDEGTSIGSAEPRPSDNKTVHAMARWIEEVAESQGRPGSVARKFVTKNGTMGAEEALEENLIDVKAENLGEILGYLKIPKAETENLERGVSDTLLSLLSTPQIALLLLILGILGLIAELKGAGVGFAGILGGICILLSFLGLHALEVNALGVLLIAAGAALMAVEVVKAGFGAFGIGGGIALLLGVIFIGGEPWVQVSGAFVWGATIALMAVFGALIWAVRRVKEKEVKTGIETMVGKRGEVTETIDPDGVVRVRGERWSATSGEKIEEGEEIAVKEVTERKGLTTLVVEKVSEAN